MHAIIIVWIILSSLLVYGAGGFVTLAVSGRPRVRHLVSHVVMVVGSLLLATGSLLALFFRTTYGLMFGHGVFSFSNISLRVDPLSALFLSLVGLVAFAAGLYSISYVNRRDASKATTIVLAFTPWFVMTMGGVLLAGNVFSFLLFWESMSVISLFLVIHHHDRPDALRAGFIYVLMTHLGTIFLTMALLIVGHFAGSYSFSQMGHVSLSPGIQSLIFIFALLGFGTKAGLVPLHVWLPRAHPIAPSHISALMSGVMIKTAVYGFILIVFQFLHVGPIWWGVAVALLGVLTACIGVVCALHELDLKRMLAYSSIENMGLIFVGIGAALIFNSYHQVYFVRLALIAALFHVMNHGLIKSLLFMSGGAVVARTRTHNMDLLGGVIRKMPVTAGLALVGSMGIAALPPTNGFHGEWLLLQALFVLSFKGPTVAMQLFGLLLIAGISLTAGLVVMAFVRFFAGTFLALPRSNLVEQATEAGVSMRFGMGFLALLCILIGVFPGIIARPLAVVVSSILRTTGGSLQNDFLFTVTAGTPSLPVAATGGLVGGLILILALLILGILWLCKKPSSVIEETWACGISPGSHMTYSPSGYSKPVRVSFRALLRTERSLVAGKGSPYFAAFYVYSSGIPLFAEKYFYRPVFHGIVKMAERIRRIQNGRVQIYLTYLFVTLIVVLIFSR